MFTVFSTRIVWSYGPVGHDAISHVYRWCSILTPQYVYSILNTYCVVIWTSSSQSSKPCAQMVFNSDTTICLQYSQHVLCGHTGPVGLNGVNHVHRGCNVLTPPYVYSISNTYCVVTLDQLVRSSKSCAQRVFNSDITI